jgi:peroxiredoxin
MIVLLVLARLGLVAVFGIAAVGKLVDREGTRRAVAEFGVPQALVGAVALGVPLVELAIAGGLLPVASAGWAAASAIALLLVFCAAIVRLLARGEAPQCRCFGSIGSAQVGRGALARNLALVGVAGFVAAAEWSHGRGSLPAFVADLGAVAIVLGLAIALQAAFSWQLFAQNGRLLERLAVLETALGSSPEGPLRSQLAIGDPAPQFALPDLDGEIVTLEELLRPGRGVSLVFTDPGCDHCNALLPALGRPRGADEPTLAVVSRGTQAANRAKAEQHGIARVLLQEDFEIAEAYGNRGVPAGVSIDAAGRIASAPAGGAQAVAELLQAPLDTSAAALARRNHGARVYAGLEGG